MTEPPKPPSLLRWLAIAAFGAVLAYLFFGEHRVHLLGYLPFLFLLACPLLHIAMHGGHRRHDGHGDQQTSPPSVRSQPPSFHQH